MDSTDELIKLLASKPNAAKIIEQTMRERGVTSEQIVAIKLFDIEPLPDDFRLLEPGTNLWLRFWKSHPEKQDIMLDWQELLEGGLFTHA